MEDSRSGKHRRGVVTRGIRKLLLEKRKKLRRLSLEDTYIDYNQRILSIEEEVGRLSGWQDADDKAR